MAALRRASASCRRMATRSPTRCGTRPTRSSPRRPTDHGRLAEVRASRSCRGPTDRPLRILTHCNTGPLACGQFGTALGVVQAAHHAGRAVHVWVDETRPYLQGARLTAWELAQAGVPHTLIPDVAAGHLDGRGRGRRHPRRRRPDRGQRRHGEQGRDVHARRARRPSRHPVLRLRAARARSTSATPDGAGDPDRGARRATRSWRSAASASPRRTRTVRNPAFDVTPAELITAIVTEEGVAPGTVRAGAASPRRRTPGPSGTQPRHGRHEPVAAAVALMATVAIGRADGVVARPTTDRALLRELPRARPALRRLRALRPRGPRVRPDPLGRRVRRRRGRRARARVRRADAPAAVRHGPRRRHRGDPARRHPAARRLRRGAARRRCRRSRRHYRVDPGPQMVRMWVDRAHVPARIPRRSSGSCRSRSASSTGSTSSGSRRGCRRARSPRASTTACASTAGSSPRPGPTSSARRPGSPSSATS